MLFTVYNHVLLGYDNKQLLAAVQCVLRLHCFPYRNNPEPVSVVTSSPQQIDTSTVRQINNFFRNTTLITMDDVIVNYYASLVFVYCTYIQL